MTIREPPSKDVLYEKFSKGQDVEMTAQQGDIKRTFSFKIYVLNESFGGFLSFVGRKKDNGLVSGFISYGDMVGQIAEEP